VAENGVKGGNRKMYGRCGEDLEIGVPVGTVIRNADTGELTTRAESTQMAVSDESGESCFITPQPFRDKVEALLGGGEK
jgi:GTP-binding protein